MAQAKQNSRQKKQPTRAQRIAKLKKQHEKEIQDHNIAAANLEGLREQVKIAEAELERRRGRLGLLQEQIAEEDPAVAEQMKQAAQKDDAAD